MKKQLVIGGIITLIILFALIPKSCNKETESPKDNGWEALKKEKERELYIKDSIYFSLKKATDLKIRQIENENILQKKKYEKQLTDLKKKYDKEYNKVTSTPIDSTIDISTRFLSEEINYSKFQK